MWFLDHIYVEEMNDMFKKINAKEKLIGWYHSGPKLKAADLEINELFKKYTPDPLLIIIDVEPKESGVPTDAYFAVEEIKDVRHSASLSHNICAPWTEANPDRRTEPPLPKPSSTPPPSSRPKNQKQSASSTYCVTSATSPSAPSPHA